MFQFDSLLDFLLMDGHGFYVWFSYVVTFVALFILAFWPYRQQRTLIIQLKRQQRIDSQRGSTKLVQ